MKFLEKFTLLSDESSEGLILSGLKNIYNSYYPFKIFSYKEFDEIVFDDITIFYGNNGSGKTTLLNIIGKKVHASRKNSINKGELFDIYINHCDYELKHDSELKEIKIISSDDVFDYLLDIRAINSKVNRKKDILSEEYLDDTKYEFKDIINDYELLKKKVEKSKMSMSKYIRTNLTNNNIIEMSNGESALNYWQNEITDNSIYLLDEPENSLSAENQLKLKKYIEESARFYNCQFIISTHSPFLLGLEGAKIYDLDEMPVSVKKWEELDNVKVYYSFFKENKDKFN